MQKSQLTSRGQEVLLRSGFLLLTSAELAMVAAVE